VATLQAPVRTKSARFPALTVNPPRSLALA